MSELQPVCPKCRDEQIAIVRSMVSDCLCSKCQHRWPNKRVSGMKMNRLEYLVHYCEPDQILAEISEILDGQAIRIKELEGAMKALHACHISKELCARKVDEYYHELFPDQCNPHKTRTS